MQILFKKEKKDNFLEAEAIKLNDKELLSVIQQQYISDKINSDKKDVNSFVLI